MDDNDDDVEDGDGGLWQAVPQGPIDQAWHGAGTAYACGRKALCARQAGLPVSWHDTLHDAVRIAWQPQGGSMTPTVSTLARCAGALTLALAASTSHAALYGGIEFPEGSVSVEL